MPRDSRGSTRARPTLLIVVAAGLLVARVAIGVHDAWRPPAPGGLVRWTAPQDARERAAAEGKPILYDFSAGWCGPCKRMEREVFANAEAAEFINGAFVPVRVNDEDGSGEATMLREVLKVRSLPTLVVEGGSLEKPLRFEGYPGKQKTLSFLRAAPSGGERGWPR